MNYQEFKQDFESSGLSQVEYGRQIGKSSSMVSYYLSRAKKEDLYHNQFTEIEVLASNPGVIRIRTPRGIEIEVPL